MKKADVANLVGIYTVLLGLSYCFYLIIVIVKGNDAVSSALLSWSATMFATIALLYTFNSWRDQKVSEILSNEAKDTILVMIKIEKLNNKIANLLSTSNPNNNEIDNLITQYSIQCNDLIEKYDFLKELIKDNNELENIFNKFERTRVHLICKYTRLLENKRNYDRKIILSLAQEGKVTYLKLSKEIKEILIEYVKYKI